MKLTYTDVLETMRDQINAYYTHWINKHPNDMWQLANQAAFVQKILAFYENTYYSDEKETQDMLLGVGSYDILTLYEYYRDEDPSNYNLDSYEDTEELIREFSYWYGGD